MVSAVQGFQAIDRVSLSVRHAAVYDALASEYDARAPALTTVTQDSLAQLLARTGDARGRALDVGCGAGLVSQGLLDAGFNTTAIDVSARMLEACRARAPEAHVLHGDYLEQRFDQPFDVIVAFAFIHLFPADLAEECVAKMRADLKPNGLLLIGTTAEPVAREGLEGKADYPGAPRRFRRRWTEEAFLDALVQAGLEVFDVARHIDPFGKRWTDVVAGPACCHRADVTSSGILCAAT
jgi:SAM-dependent methyltransferase